MGDGTNNPVRYFGRQVRKERLAAGWTLAEFGQRTGYDPAHISRIESGEAPRNGGVRPDVRPRFPAPRRLVRRVLRRVPHLDRDPALVPQLREPRAARRDPAELVSEPVGWALANGGLRSLDPGRQPWSNR